MLLKFNIADVLTPPGMKCLEVEPAALDFHIENCIVCGKSWSDTLSLKLNGSEKGATRGYCTHCGYLGLKRTFSPKWVDDYYSKEWTNLAHVDQQERTSTFSNEFTANIIERHVSNRDAKILDAGAGYGSSLRALINRGYKNVEALELSKRRVSILRDRYAIKVDHLPLQELKKSQILSKKYAAVYLWHVFEHVSDLRGCLEALHDAVEDGGHLFIAVPLFAEEHFANLIFMHVHQHTFQPHTLKYLFSQYGFTAVESTETFDGTGIRCIFKKTGSKNPAGDAKLLQTEAFNRNAFNEKMFKDFQLMFLAHEPLNRRFPILMSFFYNSSFAGTCLHRYPLSSWDQFLYLLRTKIHHYRLKHSSLIARMVNRISIELTKHLAFPQATMLFKSIEGIPRDPDQIRFIYNSNEIMESEFIGSGRRIKMWLE